MIPFSTAICIKEGTNVGDTAARRLMKGVDDLGMCALIRITDYMVISFVST